MVKLRTVQGWGFSCLEYEVNDEGEVNNMQYYMQDLSRILFHRARTEEISK